MKKNILISFISLNVVLILWFALLKNVYVGFIAWILNIIVFPFPNSNVGLQTVQGTDYIVIKLFGQMFGANVSDVIHFGVSMLILVAWMVVLLFNLPRKEALIRGTRNILIYTAYQVLTILLSTINSYSSVFAYFHNLLSQSYLILVIIILFIDAKTYKLFEN